MKNKIFECIWCGEKSTFKDIVVFHSEIFCKHCHQCDAFRIGEKEMEEIFNRYEGGVTHD